MKNSDKIYVLYVMMFVLTIILVITIRIGGVPAFLAAGLMGEISLAYMVIRELKK